MTAVCMVNMLYALGFEDAARQWLGLTLHMIPIRAIFWAIIVFRSVCVPVSQASETRWTLIHESGGCSFLRHNDRNISPACQG